MGGQQFGEASCSSIRARSNRVLEFDADRGLIAAEGGILWPSLLDYLERAQQGDMASRRIRAIRVP